MARVAQATCATCSHIRPRNEMKEVAVNRKVGTRFGISHSRRNVRESASVQFRRQMVWVCKGCRAPKSDGLIPWKTLFVLALMAGAFMWFADARTKRQVARGVGSVISTADPHVNPITQGQAAVAALLPSSTDEAKGASPTSAGRNETDATATIDWNSEGIAEARSKALDDGATKRWKGDGTKGQVVVSTPTVTGDTECRNAYSTARVDGENVRSETTKWCREQGGAWTGR